MDLENKLSAALEAFVFLADGVEKGMEAGVIDGVDGFKSDEHRFIPGTIPIGFGLTDGPAVRVGEDGAVFVDRRAMDAAAEDFRAQDGAEAAAGGGGQGAQQGGGGVGFLMLRVC